MDAPAGERGRRATTLRGRAGITEHHWRLPDALHVRLRANGVPVSGLFVLVRVKAARKNDFSSLHGPSGADGRVTATRERIVAEAGRDAQLFLMDYGHPEADAAGELEVTPLDRQATERALAAYELFRAVTEFPAGYSEALGRSLAALERLAPARLTAEVEVIGGNMAVRVRAAEA